MAHNSTNFENKKENIVLLGDGFFARGFLHYICHKKFNITQIYKDKFINPHDLMYSLQRNQSYEDSFHFKDILYTSPHKKIQEDIKNLQITNDEFNMCKINDMQYNYDYLVIGLGAHKTLKNWSDEINSFVDKKNMSIGIIGMGPIGFEIGNILSKYNKIDMFDMLPRSKVLGYVSVERKEKLLNMLENKNITTTYEQMYIAADYSHDKTLFCVGTQPNILTKNLFVNSHLQIPFRNIYVGGDCADTPDIKTGQVAYQQGVYVAKRLNGDIPLDLPFEYKPNGMSLNIGDKKILIEDHNIMPNGIYPDIVIKLYSLFFV
jgi:NADH dehydrogenase FAD-containing subunit